MDDDELLERATALEPEVASLAGRVAAERFAALVAALRDGLPVGDELFELLTGVPALRDRVNALFPPAEDGEKGYQELPGKGEIIAPLVYACPRGDYRHPVQEVGEPVPRCPAHHIALVLE
ncbi:hypothetical protein AB0F18_19320 [Streptomyces sp. NPDC029216]|uniref:hypothetical protein n=1 Tax=Streptomyces sp. NPDC029216 TaxID=3154701 RepID=UPI0034088FF9